MWIPFGVFTDVLKPSFFLFSLLHFQLTYFFWSPCLSPGCVCLQTRCDRHIRERKRGKRKPREEGKFVISLLKSCHIFHHFSHGPSGSECWFSRARDYFIKPENMASFCKTVQDTNIQAVLSQVFGELTVLCLESFLLLAEIFKTVADMWVGSRKLSLPMMTCLCAGLLLITGPGTDLCRI